MGGNLGKDTLETIQNRVFKNECVEKAKEDDEQQVENEGIYDANAVRCAISASALVAMATVAIFSSRSFDESEQSRSFAYERKEDRQSFQTTNTESCDDMDQSGPDGARKTESIDDDKHDAPRLGLGETVAVAPLNTGHDSDTGNDGNDDDDDNDDDKEEEGEESSDESVVHVTIDRDASDKVWVTIEDMRRGGTSTGIKFMTHETRESDISKSVRESRNPQSGTVSASIRHGSEAFERKIDQRKWTSDDRWTKLRQTREKNPFLNNDDETTESSEGTTERRIDEWTQVCLVPGCTEIHRIRDCTLPSPSERAALLHELHRQNRVSKNRPKRRR